MHSNMKKSQKARFLTEAFFLGLKGLIDVENSAGCLISINSHRNNTIVSHNIIKLWPIELDRSFAN